MDRMLIRVREGPYNPSGIQDRPEALEPVGRELWAGDIDDLAAAALHAAGVRAEPGTWYELKRFKELVKDANEANSENVFSTVSAPQPGVQRPWVATIEVDESSAALMVCRSVVDHVERLRTLIDIWIRVE